MILKGCNRLWQLVYIRILVGIGLSLPQPTYSQIVPDTTLPLNSQIQAEEQILTITGGTTVGNNLFHSFEQFTIPQDHTAIFDSGTQIQNIISRVTGSEISRINGILQANGTANLFLLNPNGIIFGENASLNLGGSFIASTGESLHFADGTTFSAIHPQQPLLTVTTPIGVQFGTAPGEIINQASETGLQVPNGHTLALIGGDIDMNGGIILAPGGQVELGSVAEGFVSFSPMKAGWTLNYESVETFGNLSFQNATVSTNDFGSGDIQLRGHDITLTDNSHIMADTLGSQPGGNITIQGSTVNLHTGALISASTLGAGQGGDVSLSADIITITGTNSIANLLLNIFTNQYTPDDRENGVFANSFGTGNAGNLTLNTQQLNLNQGAILSTSSFGEGLGGSLTVTSDAITLNDAGILSGTRANIGQAGNIEMNTRQLRVEGGGIIASSTLSNGVGGDVRITAEDIELVGESTTAVQLPFYFQPQPLPSGLYTLTVGTGDAGDMSIDTQRLEVREGALITTSTLGAGNGGDLVINADEWVRVIGNGQLLEKALQLLTGQFVTDDVRDGIFTASFGAGDSGSLTINTQHLESEAASFISTSTFVAGGGGDLTINATDTIDVAGAFIVTGTASSQKAGDLMFNTRNLNMADGALITTITLGSGQGGDLTVNATESVKIFEIEEPIERVEGLEFSFGAGVNLLATETLGTGTAGDLIINTRTLSVLGGQVLTAALPPSEGAAGDLTVNASESVEVNGVIPVSNFDIREVVFTNALVSATEGAGNSGDVTVNTGRLVLRNGGAVLTSTRFAGNGGNIDIYASESVEIQGAGVTPLSSSPSSLRADGRLDYIFGRETTGDAGAIRVETPRLIVQDRAVISVSNEGTGDSGNLEIIAPFLLLDNGTLTAETLAGAFGNILIESKDMRLFNNSNITTNAQGTATGGNILINTNTLVALNNSDITANAQGNFGGRVSIEALALFGTDIRDSLTPESDITATSALGTEFDGLVSLQTSDVDPISGLLVLEDNFVQIADFSPRSCVAGVTGRDFFRIIPPAGKPPTPSDALNSQSGWQDTRFNANREVQELPEMQSPRVVEAQGWRRNAEGNIVLTAEINSVGGDGDFGDLACGSNFNRETANR